MGCLERHTGLLRRGLRQIEVALRQVQAGNAHAAAGDGDGVTSLAAAKVQHVLARLQGQRLYRESSLVLGTLRREGGAVDLQVVVVEEGLVPGSFSHRGVRLGEKD